MSLLQKTCVSIQSFCCYTKVGNNIAFPTLEVMGVECAPVPTCLLSTEVHGYNDFYIRSCSEDMIKVFDHWKRENLKWDSVYTGFLASEEQVEIIKNYTDTLKDTLMIVDPAFGDNGALYATLSLSLVQKMKSLCNGASLILPNITEALYLTDRDPKSKITTKESFKVLDDLERLGAKRAIVTNVEFEDADPNFCYMAVNDGKEKSIIKHSLYSVAQHGTGDLFASIVIGLLLRGKDLKSAAEVAGKMVYLALERTDKFGYQALNSGHGVHAPLIFGELLDEVRKIK